MGKWNLLGRENQMKWEGKNGLKWKGNIEYIRKGKRDEVGREKGIKWKGKTR